MHTKIPGFRLGIYVFKDAEIVDFAAPHGVFSAARRFDPELEAFLVADSARPVQTQAGFAVLIKSSGAGMAPIDRLAKLAPACRISRARVVDSGRIITAGGIASGMEMGFYLLRRAGYDDAFMNDVARVMEYQQAWQLYHGDLEVSTVSSPQPQKSK
ncbi:MAG: hypothetical protein FJ403_02050 [Verrucomicrobia bacterium]|nr:hypothetical protein [Verrucomicrobiota bacterium]